MRQPSIIENNNTFVVFNTEHTSLLLTKANNIKCIVRNDTVRIWNELNEWLNNGRIRGACVKGPPGVGKSLVVYAFTMHYINPPESNRNVLYIRQFGISYNIICYMNKSGNTYTTIDVNEILKILASNNSWNLVVLDGIKEELMKLYFSAYSVNNTVKVLCCTSYYYLKMSIGESCWYKFINFKMYSWSLDEIKVAFHNNDNKEIFGDMTENEIDEKYYYGGGNMHLLFNPVEEIIDTLDDKIREISNMSLLLSGLKGFASNEAVYTLIAVYPNNVIIPVSEYVKQKLITYVDDSFIKRAYGTVSNNSNWKGLIFEIEFFYQLRHKNEIILNYHNAGTILISNILHIDYTNHAEYCINDVNFTYDNIILDKLKVAIIPKKWNQEYFDFVWYEKKNNIHKFKFMYCTVAHSHVFNLEYVAQFLEKLFPSNNRINLRNSIVHYNNNYKINVKICVIIPSNYASSYKTTIFNREQISQITNYDSTFGQNLLHERVYTMKSLMN